jgi:hypothetical protein
VLEKGRIEDLQTEIDHQGDAERNGDQESKRETERAGDDGQRDGRARG